MGREVRRVPLDWEHPLDDGEHIPLLTADHAQALLEWEEAKAQWKRGFVSDYHGGWKLRDNAGGSFTDWAGSRPKPGEYMPAFAPGTAIGFCMYETCSEGTPISPVFATPELLAQWLADNKASAFGSMTATYEQWLDTIRRGSSVSAVIHNGVIQSGVSANFSNKGT